MEASIIGEDEQDIGTKVVDANGVEHQIEMHKKDGEIYAHAQDGYPDDPSKRDPAEGEHVEQARRYARHHVYEKRGYDTLPEGENPDRIGGVLLAIQTLSDAEFEEWFGDIYAQLAADHHGDLTRPVEVPPEAQNAQVVVFEQGVYLRQDLETIERRAAEQLPSVLDKLEDLLDGVDLTDRGLTGIFEAVDPRQSFDTMPEVEVEGLDIDEVSGIHVFYPSGGEWHRVWGDRPDRTVDATIQMEPGELEDIETFRLMLTHHLMCQIRDCYLGMGVEPPEAYRLVGRGLWTYTTRFNNLDFYENYHDYSAEVDGYLSLF